MWCSPVESQDDLEMCEEWDLVDLDQGSFFLINRGNFQRGFLVEDEETVEPAGVPHH